VFLRVVFWLWLRELLYCVRASECDANVRVFEDVGQLSDPWAVAGEDCPFFGVAYVFVCCSYLLGPGFETLLRMTISNL